MVGGRKRKWEIGGTIMDQVRKQELYRLVEACENTDNSELESEKTAVIAELLAVVEQLERLREQVGR